MKQTAFNGTHSAHLQTDPRESDVPTPPTVTLSWLGGAARRSVWHGTAPLGMARQRFVRQRKDKDMTDGKKCRWARVIYGNSAWCVVRSA